MDKKEWIRLFCTTLDCPCKKGKSWKLCCGKVNDKKDKDND